MSEQFHHFGSRSPEYALLGFLYEKPDHGYALHQRLADELGYVWHVSQSQTYSILKRLQDQGYISCKIQEQEKLPPRQFLRITETGRHRFEEWFRATSGSSVRAIRLEFITRLYFARKLFPALIPMIIDSESAEIQGALIRLEKERDSIHPEQTFNRLSLDLRIQQLRSVHEWVLNVAGNLK
jgi:PadR family transcriptional regulator AphA